MVKNQRIIKALIACALTFSLNVNAQSFGFGDQAIGEIEAMATLPADGFKIIQTNGKLILVSSDGHYAIKGGRIFDAWHGMEIRNMADLEKSKRVPKKFMELPFEKMATISIGNKSAEEVLVYMDPVTSKGTPLIQQLIGLSDNYLFRILPIPATDERALEVQQVTCLEPLEQVAYLQGKSVEMPDLKTCGKEKMMRNVVTAMAMRVKTLPRIIAPNGAVRTGRFDVQQFLIENKK